MKPIKLRYEAATKTIRTVPENHCVTGFQTFAEGGSFDAALADRQAEIATLLSASPDLLAAVELLMQAIEQGVDGDAVTWRDAWLAGEAAVNKARGLK